VIGRVVMGMDEAGQTYYWNEFNLQSPTGENATLSFEETEQGEAWRLFTLFEPEFPITAEDAATKQVGDPLNLEGTDVRVTLVDESRVYHIEGIPPEGVELGDVARYFNAESGDTMIVVSWTGDEVECYLGEQLSEATVSSAFHLPLRAASGLARSLDSQPTTTPATKWITLVGVLLVAVVAYGGWSLWRLKRPNPLVKLNAPALPVTPAREWKLNGSTYTLLAHSVAEISEVGLRYGRHEFQLEDENRTPALLVYGFKPGGKDWVLFSPLSPRAPLTPAEAAAKRAGQTAEIDGYVFRIGGLFQATLPRTPGAELPESDSGQVFYGFTGETGSSLFLVRWNDSGIAFYRGATLPSRAVEEAAGK